MEAHSEACDLLYEELAGVSIFKLSRDFIQIEHPMKSAQTKVELEIHKFKSLRLKPQAERKQSLLISHSNQLLDL